MTEYTSSERPYLMTLKPLKSNERHKHVISYDFERKNPKIPQSDIDLPKMDFMSGRNLPAFMAPFEVCWFRKNPSHFQELLETKFERGNEEELKMLLFPKPQKKSRFCGTCNQFFEEYYQHVFTETHQAKFENHGYLPLLYNEMDEIHTEFLKNRDQYIKSAFDSEEIFVKTVKKMPKYNRDEDCKDSGLGNKQEYPYTGADGNRYTSLDQNEKTTRKEDSRICRAIRTIIENLKPKEQALDGYEVKNKTSEPYPVVSESTKHSEELENKHNSQSVEILTKALDGNYEPSRHKVAKAVKKEENKEMDTPNKPQIFIFKDEKQRKNLDYGENFKSSKYFSLLPTRNIEGSNDKTAKSVRDSEKVLLKFERKNSGRVLKRDYSKLQDTEEDIIVSFKKVKISDKASQESENESVKVDLQAISNGKWQSLRESFLGFVDGFKCKANKFYYDFWKKKDPE